MAAGGAGAAANAVLSRNGIHVRTLAQKAAVASVLPFRARAALLNLLGHDLHRSARIANDVTITGARLRMHEGSYVNLGCLLDATAELVIGANVHVGHRATVLTSTHEPGPPSQRAGVNVVRPVRIGAGAWIGAEVLVLPGVTIGEGAVVAAGAVVTADLDPHALYAGIPAERRRLMHPDEWVR
jgi:acetyltransferase-like isoleucine patch superfamily enzyme